MREGLSTGPPSGCPVNHRKKEKAEAIREGMREESKEWIYFG